MTGNIKRAELLAENARDGDLKAIDMLVEYYHKDIFKMVYYRTGSKMDAEDITQDIFIKMVKSLKHLRDTTVFKSWLYRIAVNKINDYYRKKPLLSLFVFGREPDYMETESAEDPSGNLMKKEFYSSLFEFTKMLSKNEKEIFLLRFTDQLTIKEISEALKKTESTIKTHLYRSIKKFKNNKELRALLEEGVS